MALYRPTELRYRDETKTFNGFTLFGTDGKSYLIDMEGSIVNTWPHGTSPRLLETGNIIDVAGGGGPDGPTGFNGLHEMDWEGNVVWEYREKRENYALHHDFRRIFNRQLNAYTTLFIANKSIPHDEAIAAGANPDNGPYENLQMDTIVEVDMDGNVIWEWGFFDHVIQDIDPSKPNYVGEGKSIADYPGRYNINPPGRPIGRDTQHCNSMDYNAELDQIVTNSVQGEFWVIDHGNTFIPGDPKRSIDLAAGPAGDFLYRFGDPARYGQGEPPSMQEDWTEATPGHKQIGGSHDIQWIERGLPGAGNFLLFNNGQSLSERTPQSYIFEINGFLDADKKDTGNYVNPPDAGYYILEQPEAISRNTHKRPKYISNQVLWIYGAQCTTSFFSHIGSGCQRLPNGNTLICAMTEGHIFEVTPEGECVWEYINPVVTGGKALKVMPDLPPMSNAVFRAYRYAPDHTGLKGKDLTPGGTITEANNT